MLHVTNGDSAAAPRIRAAVGTGDVLPWRDALHEGPVPAGLDPAALRAVRARFIAARGWAAEAAALDATARARRAPRRGVARRRADHAVVRGRPLRRAAARPGPRPRPGRAPRAARARRHRGVPRRRRAFRRTNCARTSARPCRRPTRSAPQAAALWDAFRAPDPRALERVPPDGPFGAAARRLLQQFPWTGSGLNRTERALLAAVAAGARTREDAFVAQQREEERPFMGDTIAFDYLSALPVTGTRS